MRDELDAGERALVEELRALPSEGREPDWRALEQAITEAVGPTVPAAPWWRAWRWLVPAGAAAVTVLGVIAWSVVREAPAPRAPRPSTAAPLAAHAVDEELESPDDMFAVDDLTWVDEADDAELDQVEAALAAAERKRS